MTTAGRRLDVANILSYGDDLVRLLLDSKDGEPLEQACEGVGMLRSACRSESRDLELQVKEYQDKIISCKERLDKAKSETVTDEELNALQKEMEEKLQSEQQLRQDLRAVSDELDNLDLQRDSVEERKDAVKKKEKDMLKARSVLSMCVSVTNIMPNFDDKDKVSGYIVDKNMKKVDKFEFEKTMSPVEMCDKHWKMI